MAHSVVPEQGSYIIINNYKELLGTYSSYKEDWHQQELWHVWLKGLTYCNYFVTLEKKYWVLHFELKPGISGQPLQSD